MAYIYRLFHLTKKKGIEKNYNLYLVIKMGRTAKKKTKS